MEGKGSDDEVDPRSPPRPSPRGAPAVAPMASPLAASGGGLLSLGVGLVTRVLSALLSPIDRIVGGGYSAPPNGAVRAVVGVGGGGCEEKKTCGMCMNGRPG